MNANHKKKMHNKSNILDAKYTSKKHKNISSEDNTSSENVILDINCNDIKTEDNVKSSNSNLELLDNIFAIYDDDTYIYSFYNFLFKKTFINHTYLNRYDISYPNENVKDEINYNKNAIKKTIPFKTIYNSLISQYISEAQAFFDENGFSKEKTHSYNAQYKISKGGSINEFRTLKIVETKKSKISDYSNNFFVNKNTIIITDQIYNKLKNKNMVVLFSVKQLSNFKITKFVDLKIRSLNFEEAIELFAYERIKQTVGSSEFKVYESAENKIVIICSSSFIYNNEVKRIYGLPDEKNNVQFVLHDEILLPVNIVGKRKKYLNWLNGIDLDEGEYVCTNGKIYKVNNEGFMFSANGFVLNNLKELE